MAEQKNKWWAVFAYLLGVLSVIVYFMKKEDSYVRFHAVQSIIFSVVVIVYNILAMLFSIMSLGIAALLFMPIGLILFILWLFALWYAYKGERYKLPLIGEYVDQYSK